MKWYTFPLFKDQKNGFFDINYLEIINIFGILIPNTRFSFWKKKKQFPNTRFRKKNKNGIFKLDKTALSHKNALKMA